MLKPPLSPAVGAESVLVAALDHYSSFVIELLEFSMSSYLESQHMDFYVLDINSCSKIDWSSTSAYAKVHLVQIVK